MLPSECRPATKPGLCPSPTSPTRSLEEETDTLALGLVREYLVKRGYHAAATALDAAKPRDSHAITSRKALARGLGVEKIIRKYTIDEHPKAVTLDAVVAYLLDRAAAPNSKMPRSTNRTRGEQQQAPSPQLQPPTISSIALGTKAVTKAKWFESQGGQKKERIHVAGRLSSAGSQGEWVPQRGAAELVVEDLDEELQGLDKLELESMDSCNHSRYLGQTSQGNGVARGSDRGSDNAMTLSLGHGVKIRKLLFGPETQAPESWMQGFYFSDQRNLEFGLIQRRGGPCGVLAAMQAFVVDDLLQKGLFKRYDARGILDERDASLARAIARILWQASESKQRARVVQFDSHIPEASPLDWLASRGCVHTFRSKPELETFVRSRLSTFQENGGILTFLYSLILTHGIDEVHQDRDEAAMSPMIGEYDYCSQDLVNLMLTGAAVPNVFDRDRVLETQASGGKGSKSIILKGVKRRSTIGFLTLHEFYENVEVGSFLKNPTRSVWVVCSESHFTCLFSLEHNNSGLEKGASTLWYYDSLANQTEPITLTIERSNIEMEEECPPLEKVISTRWGPIIATWKGSEPLL